MRKILIICVVLSAGSVSAQRAMLRPGVDPTTIPYWHVKGEGWGQPAADASRVFFMERSRTLVALDQATGALQWRQAMGARGSDPFGWVLKVAGPNVLSSDSRLQAFDRESGTPRWTFAPGDDPGAGAYPGAVVDDLVYLGSPNGRIYAVDALSGTPRWRAIVTSTSQTLILEPDADRDIVVGAYRLATIPQSGGVIALDARTGAERWRTAFPRPANAALGSNAAGNAVLVDDVVLAATGYGEIFAFDRVTGAVRWSLPKVQGLPTDYFVSTDFDFRVLTIAGRRLIAGSLTGAVTAYDLDTRREVWRNIGQRLASVGFGITADDRAAYVPYLGSRFVAIDLLTGEERWRAVQPGGGFSFPPLVVGHRLFVASAASGFYALRR